MDIEVVLLEFGDTAKESVLLLLAFFSFWGSTMISMVSAGSKAAGTDAAEQRPAPSGRCLDLGGVDGRLMALGYGHIDLGQNAISKPRPRNQEPKLGSFLLLAKTSHSVVISGYDKAFVCM